MARTKVIFLFFIALSFTILQAKQVEISSDSFFADEVKQVGDFSGNVVVKNGDYDKLWAKNIKVFFNKKKEPLKYVATGDVKFQLSLNKKHYQGSAQNMTYDPISGVYVLEGDSHLKENESEKNIFGNKITINQKNGTYSVSSDEKKPVKFIFHIEDKK